MRRAILRFEAHPLDRLWGHATSRPQRALLMLVTLVSLLMLALALAESAILSRQLAAAQQALAARREAARPRSAKPVVPLAPSALRSYNEATNLLNTPWSDIFDTLEEHAAGKVALVSIEPDSARGSVRMEAEARTLEDLLAYAAALGTSSKFSRVNLVKHEQMDRDPSHPVRLTLDAQLSPPVSLPQRMQP